MNLANYCDGAIRASGARRYAGAVWLLAVGLIGSAFAQSDEGAAPPARYEVLVNGEPFTIELNQPATLRSTADPKVTYQVAIRVAEYQPWRLRTIGFDYHRGFTVDDDRGEAVRTATLKHSLGFAMVISDLGGTLSVENRARAMKLLVEANLESVRGEGAEQIEVIKPQEQKLGAANAVRAGLRYQNRNAEHRSLIYLIRGEQFACTCIVQYLAEDQANVLPLVRPTLESIAALSSP